jgi:hypothetical protein
MRLFIYTKCSLFHILRETFFSRNIAGYKKNVVKKNNTRSFKNEHSSMSLNIVMICAYGVLPSIFFLFFF